MPKTDLSLRDTITIQSGINEKVKISLGNISNKYFNVHIKYFNLYITIFNINIK